MNLPEAATARTSWGARGVEATGFLLLFLMLCLPAAHQSFKALLLLAVGAALLIRIVLERRIRLHPEVACGCLLFSVVGAGCVLRGYLSGAPGALRVSTVYVIWPLTSALLITGLTQVARLWRMTRLLVYATVVICSYCAIYILWAAGWWPDALFYDLGLRQRIAFYDGIIEFSIDSLSSLLFLIPFTIAGLLVWPRQGPVSRVLLWLALGLGLVIGLLSGRRALQLILALSPLIALAFWRLLPASMRAERAATIVRSLIAAAVVSALAVVVLQSLYGLDLQVVWATFKTGFQFGADPVAQTRSTQFDALIDGWLASPFFGSGHGAPAPGLIRSEGMPWAYELAYTALLYHTGLVGFLLYALGIGWIYVEGVRVIRRGTSLAALMVPMLTGMSTFLIANATNPYLEKFDSMWTIFLPLAIVNASLLNGYLGTTRRVDAASSLPPAGGVPA